MAYSEIAESQVDAGSPIDDTLMGQMRNNQVDHQARIVTLENGGNLLESSARIYDDFMFLINYSGASIYSMPCSMFLTLNAGAGSLTQDLATMGGTIENDHPGVLVLSTGSTTTGSVQITPYTSIIKVGGGQMTYECMVRIPALADGTDDYNITVGFYNSLTNLIAFVYDRDTSTKWLARTDDTTGPTNTEASAYTVTVDVWYRLRIVVNAAGTSVAFYIAADGGTLTLVATHTLDIPSVVLTPTVYILKEAGTGPRTMWLDYLEYKHSFTSNR